MITRAVLITILFLTHASFLPTCLAEDLNAIDASFVDELVQEKIHMIERWETTALIILSLLVTIGVLGVVTGMLQSVTKSWSKTATVIVGTIVSLLTVVHTTAFEVDHRILKKKAHEGRKIVREIKFLMKTARDGQYNTANKKDLVKLYQDVHVLIAKIDGLADDLYMKTSHLNITAVAYAGTVGDIPAEWRQQIQEVSVGQNRFYIGEGRAKTLEEAEEAARKDASLKIISDLKAYWKDIRKDSAPTDQEVAVAIEKRLTVEASRLAYDGKEKTYVYSLLARANRERLAQDIIFKRLIDALNAAITKTAGAAP